MTRILVVDDEPQILRALAINLRARGYEVDLAPNGETALTLAGRELLRPVHGYRDDEKLLISSDSGDGLIARQW